jgi:exodeoxyribonuclease-5
MNRSQIQSLLLKKFPYDPTSGQKELVELLAGFLIDPDKNSLFLIKGYAGTGKTTIVSSLVEVLPYINKRFFLLAPTGRAAKVLARYSSKSAFTIHKKIYSLKTSKDGSIKLVLRKNLHKNTLFIVDEASMIQDSSVSGSQSLFTYHKLFEDLFFYVYNGENCKLLLIGDTAQLPPVGLNISPALDLKYLKTNYNVSVTEYELKQVVRQSLESGILMNATTIRDKIAKEDKSLPVFTLKDHKDIERINGYEFEDCLNQAYSLYDLENTIVITRSNKRANLFNQEIRNRILFKENEISSGDLMMVVKNDYYWLAPDSVTGFIANGDIIEIVRLHKIRELYSFRFADVTVRLLDYPEEIEFDTKIILDTIMAEAPALPPDLWKNLYKEVMQDYMNIPQKKVRMERVRNNPYFNALQVKFAYAMTCHKTQGGQWQAVFVDQGYITDKHINKEFLRWLYTAVSRAAKKLYLVNFHDRFFY